MTMPLGGGGTRQTVVNDASLSSPDMMQAKNYKIMKMAN